MKKIKALLFSIMIISLSVALLTFTSVFADEVKPSAIKSNIVAFGTAEGTFDLGSTNNQGLTVTQDDTVFFEGTHSMKLVSTGSANRTLLRLAGVKTDGTVYYISGYIKSSDDVSFAMGGCYTSQNSSDGWIYPTGMAAYKAVTSDWTLYQATIAFTLDTENHTLSTVIDGGTPAVTQDVKTAAAFDIILSLDAEGKTVYLDNLLMGEVQPESTNKVKNNIIAWGDGEGSLSDIGANVQGLTLTQDSKFVYDGTYSIKLSATKAPVRSLFRLACKTDGTKYIAKAFVRSAGEAQFGFGACYTSQDTSSGWVYTEAGQTLVTANNYWTYVEFVFAFEFDEESHVLSLKVNDQVATSTQNVASPAGFDLCLYLGAEGQEAWVDNISFGELEVKKQELPDETYENAIVHYSFEDGLQGFEASGTTPVLFDSKDEAGCAYKSEKSIKISGIWGRKWLNSEEIVSGTFYEMSAYVKLISDTTSQGVVELYVWDCDSDGENYHMGSTRIRAINYTYLNKDEWTRISGKFAIYSDGKVAYAYHNGGQLEVLSDVVAGHVFPAYNLADFGVTNAGSAYWDDIAIKPTTVNKTSKITVVGFSDATIVVAKNGTDLTSQPEITNDNGVYSIAALPFSGLNDTYTLKILVGGDVVGTKDITYINNEVSFSPAYNAVITVVDEDSNPITDAIVALNNVDYTENVNGVYTISSLSSSYDVVVSNEGKMTSRFTISSENSQKTVVLKTMVVAKDIVDNIFDLGTIESPITYAPNAQGVVIERTDEDQYDGQYSLKETATKENAVTYYRLAGLKTDATTYYVEVMAKSTNSAQLKLIGLFTSNNVSGGWAYPKASSPVFNLTDTWAMYSFTFAIRFDEVNRNVYGSINGAEETLLLGDISAIAAFDFGFMLPVNNSVAYIDNVTILECYDGKVTVIGETGEKVDNATFDVVDHAGRTLTITPTYSSGVYTFAGLKGNVSITAKEGTKSYAAVALSKSNKEVTIEDSYNITITLKDQNGNLVSGATLVARKGISAVGEVTDNGNGTYTIANVMGEVSIIATKEGYTFTKKTGVNANNNTVEIIGEKEITEEPTTEKKKGCGSTMAIPMLALFGAAFVVCSKKRV